MGWYLEFDEDERGAATDVVLVVHMSAGYEVQRLKGDHATLALAIHALVGEGPLVMDSTGLQLTLFQVLQQMGTVIRPITFIRPREAATA